MLNLDTNIVLEGLTGRLTERELELLDDQSIAISDIVFWEISKLVQLKRIVFDLESPSFRKFLRQVTVFPITVEIARRSIDLDFRSDPADELIAATSIVERIPLLTRDGKILKSKMVPLAI